MADAATLIKNASKSAEIFTKLSTAQVFVVCADGTIYYLEKPRMRAPLKARVCTKEALLERITALPQSP